MKKMYFVAIAILITVLNANQRYTTRHVQVTFHVEKTTMLIDCSWWCSKMKELSNAQTASTEYKKSTAAITSNASVNTISAMPALDPTQIATVSGRIFEFKET